MANEKELIEKAILSIQEVYGVSRESVQRLMELTNGNEKVRFVSIKGYNSDKSLNTEVADQVVNINANYGNMLDKDALTLNNVVLKRDVEPLIATWDYEGKYDLNGVSVADFKKQVKEALEIALQELRNPKTGSRESNDIWLNKALAFNTNTLRLSVFGASISKTVKQEGVYKKVKSAPKTVAKQIIQKAVEPRTAQIRRFTMDNLSIMKMDGETLEIGGGQTEGVEIKA
ncbi:MAG: hypothetical protein F2817_21325 [Actinobacteria bacterium]|nr:hypothetical protein [Actinomycetota bacterium]